MEYVTNATTWCPLPDGSTRVSALAATAASSRSAIPSASSSTCRDISACGNGSSSSRSKRGPSAIVSSSVSAVGWPGGLGPQWAGGAWRGPPRRLGWALAAGRPAEEAAGGAPPTKAQGLGLSELETLNRAAAVAAAQKQPWEVDPASLTLPGPYRRALSIQELRSLFRRHSSDCGSSEFQIAGLTAAIGHLTQHVEGNAKDFNAKRRLIAMVQKRRRFLKYLGRTNEAKYEETLRRLGLKRVLLPNRLEAHHRVHKYALFTNVNKFKKSSAQLRSDRAQVEQRTQEFIQRERKR
eukprot:GHVT01063946.1.p1 GENE.GHVT01063946.1~~GHVT01063946.1.p1  ORF type:complete len:295 (-),score=61.14 GHVT01063946.1:1058-1942(-)